MRHRRSGAARSAFVVALGIATITTFVTVYPVNSARAQSLKGFLKDLVTPTAPLPARAAPSEVAPEGREPDGQAADQGAFPAASRQWVGYSHHFQALRPLLLAGDFAAAKIAYETGKDGTGGPIALPSIPAIGASAGQQATLAGLNPIAMLSAAGGQRASADGTGAAFGGGEMKKLASDQPTFIGNVEIATLLLDGGDVTTARALFDAAGELEGTAAKAKRGIGASLRSATTVFSNLVGNPELGPYPVPDFERVLQLNYLALSYLLLGDDKAFNVSQRSAAGQRDALNSLNEKATRLQDEARVAFEAERAEGQAKLAKAQQDPDEEGASTAVGSQLSAAYATEDYCKAPNLPSAFVNPLSFYLNGIVNEISSAQFPEDRSTARISYEKALQLAPSASVLSSAVRDLNSDRVRPGRLAHFIVAEGFAPTRQAIKMQVSYGQAVAPITIPRLTCHPSEIAAIEVRTVTGATLARLEPVADIEGIMLQRQKDREGLTSLAVLTGALRGAMESTLASKNVFAGLAVQAKQAFFDRPDMRSWSTLPARMYGGRIYLPDNVSEVDIVTLDTQTRVKSSIRASIDTSLSQNLIYARAVQSKIIVAPAAQTRAGGL